MDAAVWALYQQAELHYCSAAVAGGAYPPQLHMALHPQDGHRAIAQIARWPGYTPTPLHSLPTLAAQAQVGGIFYKDESARFNLRSFKALGGAFAVSQLLSRKVFEACGVVPDSAALAAGKYAAHIRDITVAAATDGNHGRSLAWGARMFGCRSRIFVHAGVSARRRQAMEELGAQVECVRGNYDDSVRCAAAAAEAHGWFVVSDTSYPGYTEVPQQVMAGYCMMVDEVLQQAPAPFTHVFVQGGVGGLAAAVCAWLWHKLGARLPRLIVVEPALAGCLYQSAKNRRLTTVEIGEETMMAGLSCGEPSTLAWDILSRGASGFMTIQDALIAPLMRHLAAGQPPVEGGESGVAGLAGLLAAAVNTSCRSSMGMDGNANILVFGSEGATDPEIYKSLLGG